VAHPDHAPPLKLFQAAAVLSRFFDALAGPEPVDRILRIFNGAGDKPGQIGTCQPKF
jgi:hypothetical protein